MASVISDLSGSELRRAIAALHALSADGGGCANFVRDVLDELPRHVDSDLTTLSICDLKSDKRTVIGRRDEALSDGDQAAFNRHFSAHPLVRFHGSHPAGPTRRVTDCTSITRFREQPIYAEYYRRIGIDYVMAVPLRIDHCNVVSVVFNRASADFKDRERALLEALRRPLAVLYQSILVREEAQLSSAALRELAAGGGWLIARVRADGRIIDAGEDARAALREFFGEFAASPQTLPRALEDWLGRRRHWGLDRAALQSDAVFTVSRNGKTLKLHAVSDATLSAACYLLMKVERAGTDAEQLGALPLTEREREILALLPAGKTNAEIGTLLGISARTVQKHLEHIFQKLGVETRTAAALRAVAAAADRQHEGSTFR
jgi:DNA-binding CsgD family transcriptional regulator